jgi:acetyl esterase/lipase
MSPVVDLAFPGESIKANQEKDGITPARLDMIREQYLAGQDPRDPLASPIHGDLSGLPPMLLQVGSHELLLDDVSRFAEKARQAGVQVTLEVWEGMIHTWQIFASAIHEGRQAIDLAGRFIRASLTSR